MRTTHPDGPHFRADSKAWLQDLQKYARATRFEGLRIVESSVEDDGLCAHVVFEATLSQSGRDLSFSERSSFLFEDGRWRYLDGEVTPLFET